MEIYMENLLLFGIPGVLFLSLLLFMFFTKSSSSDTDDVVETN